MKILGPDILAQMEDAARCAMFDVRDRAAMKQVCAEMDRISEEIQKKHGVLDIGVPAIRELRGEIRKLVVAPDEGLG
jgi:hypothetical protein